MIGSPIVFQTAPPQPASNALATWPYVFVGGPEASQKGFGDSIPAKFTRKSAMGPPAQRFVNPRRRRNPVRGRVHDFRSTVRAVAADEHLGMVRRYRQLRSHSLS